MGKQQKRHRSRSPSTTATSAGDLLSSSVDLISSKPGKKSSLKTLIHSLSSSSPLLSSLPPCLSAAVSRSLVSFKSSTPSSLSRPFKRSRLSPQNPKNNNNNSSSNNNNNNNNNNEIENPYTVEEEDSLRQLRAYAYVTHLCVTHPKKLFSAIDLLPAARSLHDSLVLFESDEFLLSEIASLCEHWWKEKFSGRENLVSLSVPFLLSRSLTYRRKTDVKRVYALREALELFDYVDDSIEDVRMLLVRCVIAPVYLRTDEGRRFVAFVMGLNLQLTKDALALIKSQIPFGRKSVLEAYADVSFRAWKASEGELREEMEDNFLQGLIDGAIHASTKSLAASVRRVLGGFVQQRATEGVEKLLFRLAEPVLFRSLQVANSNVRQNALHLFLDLFPLEDPAATKEDKDTLLQKQFFLLEKLLLDDCPDVRMVAVEGSCRILHLFWEVIPSSMIAKTLTKITDNMSQDMSNDVRLSTVNGLIYLLSNPQSHEILKVLLPRIGYMFSDRALSVRLAVTDLLLALRDIQAFQFSKVVALDGLLSSLANDHPIVAQKIAKLLIPSYFPSKANRKEACGRCMALMKRNPTAWARFCEFALSEGSSTKSLMELLGVCVNFVLLPKDLNSDQMNSLCIASANMCGSLLSEPSCRKALNELFSCEKLKSLLTAAVSNRAKAAIINIASMVCPNDLSGFQDQCMVLVMNSGGLSDDIEKQEVIQAAHKLLCRPGWFGKLFVALISELQNCASGFQVNECPIASSKNKRVKASAKSSTRSSSKSAKGSTRGMSDAKEKFAAAAAAAWQMKYMLANVETRNLVMHSSMLESAFSSLKVISHLSIEQCVHWESVEASPLLVYLDIAMCMSLPASSPDTSASGIRNDLSPRPTTLDLSLNELLCLMEEFLFKDDAGKANDTSTSSKQDEETPILRKSKRKEQELAKSAKTGHKLVTGLSEAKRAENTAKLVTSILKVIVDFATVKLLRNSEVRCLQFASAYVRYIASSISRCRANKLSFKDEELKDMLACLKSSFTYMGKLLHLVLTACQEPSSTPVEVFQLSGDLIDLIASVESNLGSYYASVLINAAKIWLPVLILGLSSKKLVKEIVVDDRPRKDEADFQWLDLLCKLELSEITENNEVEQGDHVLQSDFPVFRKFMESIVALLRKGSPRVMDAVGSLFLEAIEARREREGYDFMLGLVHFVCVKLVGKEYAAMKELELMSSTVKHIYSELWRNIASPSLLEDERQRLGSVKILLDSLQGI